MNENTPEKEGIIPEENTSEAETDIKDAVPSDAPAESAPEQQPQETAAPEPTEQAAAAAAVPPPPPAAYPPPYPPYQQIYGAPPRYQPYPPYQGDPRYAAPRYQPTAYPPRQEPEIPPVSEIAEKERSKGTKGWMIAFAVSVVLLLTGVMVLLAVYSAKNSDGSGSADTAEQSQEQTADSEGSPAVTAPHSSGSGVVVNIETAPVPVQEDRYYQNKETGLLTPAGTAKAALPSIVCVYCYGDSNISYISEASGMILTEDGYIVTNAHVVEEVKTLKVKLSDNSEHVAELIGSDPKTDIAVIKINAEGLTPMTIGDASMMEQGDQVVAYGNSNGMNNTLTIGIISHTDRTIASYAGGDIRCFQTDAAMNSGVSGGALLNMYGQAIGILTSKNADTDIENMGFAIRMDFALPVIEDLMSVGYVTGRPRVGVMYRYIDPVSAEALGVRPGMLISEIAPECDIANTDIQPDDIITVLDGRQLITESAIADFQAERRAGDTITAKVYRRTITGEETEFEITFTLDEMK